MRNSSKQRTWVIDGVEELSAKFRNDSKSISSRRYSIITVGLPFQNLKGIMLPDSEYWSCNAYLYHTVGAQILNSPVGS